ncbi:MAG: hypothetical protein JNL01_10055 [Bdellovibrionales bacterium]|nr:hypothetical protein [Bdellovibrionales bacterium]
MRFQNLSEKLNESQVGAKAFHLSRMIQLGVSVPEGFVVATQGKPPNVNSMDAFKTELLKRASEIRSDRLMIRSSAVGEDSGDASFAGQLDSFSVNNTPDEILQGFFRCLESLNGKRAEVYGQKSGRKLDRMGVIVQRMISPDYAGVLFTRSPLNPKEALLEFVDGHAEKLVSGQVTPVSVSFTWGQVPKGLPFDPTSLFEQAQKIQENSTSPQDIEWTVVNQKASLVQARPITSILEDRNWSNTNVNENYPDRLTPFLASLARESYYHYFKNLAIQLGGYDSILETELRSIIGTWGWKMYYNMTSIHQILAQSPFAGLFRKSFDDFVGYTKDSPSIGVRLQGIRKKLGFALNLLFQFVRLPARVAWIEKEVQAHSQAVDQARDLKSLSKAYHQFLNLRFNEWHRASFADLFAMITHGILGKICSMADPQKASGLQNQLIQSIPGLVSNQPIFEIHRLASLIQEDQGAGSTFVGDAENAISWMHENPESEITQAFERYLLNWGFRCSGELTLTTPNYIDDPRLLVQVLQSYLKSSPRDPESLFLKKSREQKDILQKTREKLGFPWATILSLTVQATAYSISCRERVRLKQAQMYHSAKRILKALGQKLATQGKLEKVDDIFFLEYPEVSRIFSGEELDSSLVQALVQSRRKSFDQAKPAPDEFSTRLGEFKNDPIPSLTKPSTTLTADGNLHGLSACGGIVEGTIRVLESIHEIPRIQKGDILVTKQTDPGWICAFPVISGLIVERGGMLSHGAIVAREFGIPAVVAVDQATSILKDGSKVRLDAYQGRIECLN